jgi:hypothetical protein
MFNQMANNHIFRHSPLWSKSQGLFVFSMILSRWCISLNFSNHSEYSIGSLSFNQFLYCVSSVAILFLIYFLLVITPSFKERDFPFLNTILIVPSSIIIVLAFLHRSGLSSIKVWAISISV